VSHCGGGRDSRKVGFHCLPARFMLRGHLGRWYLYLYLYLPWVRPSFGRGSEGEWITDEVPATRRSQGKTDPGWAVQVTRATD
jgi:hypothetical protein